MTTFSIVSITFTIVIIERVGLEHMFFPFYLTVVVAGFIAALIMPRIPPLSRKEDSYVTGSKNQIDESVPEGYNSFTFGYKKAIERSQKEKSIGKFFKEGLQNDLRSEEHTS